MRPRVSIILPVFNAGSFLASCLDSLLAQSFKDFEILAIDDGSTDSSKNIIKHYSKIDRRIKLVSHKKNKGLIYTLNEGVELAEGEYIARHDADDRSVKQRLEKQVCFLDRNPQVGLVGSNYHVVDDEGDILNTTNVFTLHDDLKMGLIFSNQFGHGTVMIRRLLLEKFKYRESKKYVEDYDLWIRLSHATKLANIKEPLYLWKTSWQSSHEGISGNSAAMQKAAYRLRDKEFDRFLSNREKYRVIFFAPNSTLRPWVHYLNKKSTLYRNMALMYSEARLKGSALKVLMIALICVPWSLKTYKQIALTLLDRNLKDIEYEYV